jgi:cell division protein FtsW (lipid II flippase)
MESAPPRRWIGRWVVAVALLHAVGALFIYPAPLREMAGAGLIATADDYSLRATAYWFFAFAPVLGVLGLLIDAMEVRRVAIPFGAALLLLLTLIVMVAVMPVNGAWLLFPPAIALLLRSRN